LWRNFAQKRNFFSRLYGVAVNITLFGQRLQRFREQRGWTQLALAQHARVPQSVISDLEAGKREGVTLEMAWRLARALSVSLDYLAGIWEEVEVTEPAPGDTAASRPAGPLARGPRRRGRPRKAATVAASR
jgi:transcriptional regulator with XRE-family HTH domain